VGTYFYRASFSMIFVKFYAFFLNSFVFISWYLSYYNEKLYITSIAYYNSSSVFGIKNIFPCLPVGRLHNVSNILLDSLLKYYLDNVLLLEIFTLFSINFYIKFLKSISSVFYRVITILEFAFSFFCKILSYFFFNYVYLTSYSFNFIIKSKFW
jgi:hypothetical protein